MQEMEIDSIRANVVNYQRVVILKQKEGDRYIPIWIGPSEAEAIAVRLHDVSVPRPLTHDLLFNMIGQMGGVVDHVVVSRLDHDTFYAVVSINVGERKLEVDARPSDALALAVRAKVPIFAADDVLEKAGVQIDRETGAAMVGSDAPEEGQSPTPDPPRPMGKEERERLSAFEDFIESLDMGGLGDEDQDSGKKKGD